jgi:hypothetical protein
LYLFKLQNFICNIDGRMLSTIGQCVRFKTVVLSVLDYFFPAVPGMFITCYIIFLHPSFPSRNPS